MVVVGATPGGIATSITAARLGRSVALVEYHHHVGGMSASGLGKSDIHTRSAVAGLFTEFTDRVLADYVSRYGADSEEVKKCRDGYYYEPSVAERIFGKMLAEQSSIKLFTGTSFRRSQPSWEKVGRHSLFEPRLEKNGRIPRASVYRCDLRR